VITALKMSISTMGMAERIEAISLITPCSDARSKNLTLQRKEPSIG
jgi:hypothetical protein